MVTNLAGSGLVLQNNGGSNLTVSADGSFTFSAPVASGSPYDVTVLTQPATPIQYCAVTNGSGVASANVATIQVACRENLGTLTTLYNFCQLINGISDCPDGLTPVSGVVRGVDGNLYGTTLSGGGGNAGGGGSAFQYTSGGVLNTIWGFCQTGCSDGTGPQGLVQGADGNFYGATSSGGANSNGTVFMLEQQNGSWTLTTLWSFCSQTYANGSCTDGSEAGFEFDIPLIQGTDGAFYGATAAGGSNLAAQCYSVGCGTVFKISQQNGTWQLTTLYNFCAQTGCSDGAVPEAGLVQGADGNFYGTTFGSFNGTSGAGTVFKITPTGALTTLYSFCSVAKCTDGANPAAGLTLATDGNFYGTTFNGGANSSGTAFKIIPSGTLTTLYSFCSATECTDGANPKGALMQASDGNFYGITFLGGYGYGTTASGLVSGTRPEGTVFKMTSTGTLTTLYSFCSVTDGDEDCFDGYQPSGGLVQGTDGLIYGTTSGGRISALFRSGGGTLFSLGSLENSANQSRPAVPNRTQR
jgi:uncharacterized repeat protein (TIGR03803 family)